MLPLEVGRDAGRFAEINMLRQLQKIGRGVERNLRNLRASSEPRRIAARRAMEFSHAIHRRLRVQDDLLHAPGGDLRNQDLVRIAAIDLVHRAELPSCLPALPNLPRIVPSSSIL